MPGYTTVIEAKYGRKSVARATLRTPGDWFDLTDIEKAAWNKATAAINALFELYLPKEENDGSERNAG